MHKLNELSFNNFVMFLCVFLLFWLHGPSFSLCCVGLSTLTSLVHLFHNLSSLAPLSSFSLFPFTLSWLSHFHTHIIYLLLLTLLLITFHLSPLSPHHLTPFSTTISSSLYHYQTSAYVFGLNTWSMSRHSVMVSPRTSGSHWSDNLSCLVKPAHCCAQEIWVPLSATSSLQNWTTSRLSGVITWVELCWRLWRESSSLTRSGWQQAQRVSAYWSVWTKMTMRRAEGCWKLDKCCHPIMVQLFKTTRWNGTYEDLFLLVSVRTGASKLVTWDQVVSL